MRKLQHTLPKRPQAKIFKSFTRLNLDYSDVVYDRASNELCLQSLESLQYSAAVIITEAFRGTSSKKFSQELGLETLKSRPLVSKLCLLYKLIK